MDKLNLIRFGALEERYNIKQDEQSALELIAFLAGFQNQYEKFLATAMDVITKFPESLKILFNCNRYSKAILQLGAESFDKEDSSILAKYTQMKEDTSKRMLEIAPTDDTDLRIKLLMFREKNMPDQALPEIARYEDKYGVTSQTLMMRADFYKHQKQIENITPLHEKLVGVDDKDKYLAAAYLDIQANDLKDRSCDSCLENILKSLIEFPDNEFAFNILALYNNFFFPKPDLLRDILVESLKKERSFQVLNLLLSFFIQFTVFFPNDELFEKMRSMAHPLDAAVVDILSVLCLHFDDYGLARYIYDSWNNPQASMTPEFSTYLSNVASDLAQRCQSGVGLKPVRKEEFEERKDSLYTKLVSASVACMERYLSSSPDSADAHLKMGFLLKQYKHPDAKSHFEKASKLEPGNHTAKLNLGLAFVDEGDNITAYSHFLSIINDRIIDTSYTVEALIQASEIAIKFGWIAEGEQYLATARSILPYDHRVTVNLAKIYLKEAKIIGSDFALDEAKDLLAIVVSKDPNNIIALYYLSQVYYMKKEYLLAIRSFMKSTHTEGIYKCLSNFWISRSYHQLYNNLLFSSPEYLQSAIKFAEKLTDISKKVPMAYEYLANLYEEAGEKEKAQKLLESIEKKELKIDKTSTCDLPGEVKVLSVYAPQILRPDSDSDNIPKRYFSIGSIGKIEVSYLPGKGDFEITGNLGDSFVNSIQVAYKFFIRYLTAKGLMPRDDRVMHIDVPGWYPKYDGPSAGLPIALAMISAYTGKPLPREVTMTGEISSMGRVMAVGGIKEKIEATNEKGVKAVFIPRDNKWDYLDMLLKRAAYPSNLHVPIPDVFDVACIHEVIDMLGIGID
ncbi:MAG: S16 family serine protease [Caldisericia bacterium]